jgi:disulfide bond formation protein DsbB
MNLISIKQRIKEKSIELASSSTFIGLPNIIRTEKKGLKLMWLILFIFGSCAGIYTVFKTINCFLDYDVVTSIKVYNEIPAKFPTITFILLKNSKQLIPLDKLIESCFFNELACNLTSDFEIIKDKILIKIKLIKL